MLITVALLGVGGYVIWYFLGQPSGEDIANTFGNIDFGDFSDVLENFTGIGPGTFAAFYVDWYYYGLCLESRLCRSLTLGNLFCFLTWYRSLEHGSFCGR